MVRITVDDELRKKFFNFTEDIELCDETGRVVARLQSVTHGAASAQWEPLTPEPDRQEIERRLQKNEPTYSTEEVVSHLRSL